MSKRTTPLQAKQGKKQGMEGYAAKRQAELKKQAKKGPISIMQAREVMMHDPEGDLHHLMRAAEVKADKKRHKAAMQVGQQRMQAMRRVMMGGDKDEG